MLKEDALILKKLLGHGNYVSKVIIYAIFKLFKN